MASSFGILRAVMLLCLTLSSEAQVRSRQDALRANAARLELQSGGKLGFAAELIESNRWAGFRQDERFPMQSVYKLPIAIHFLHLVEVGKIHLDEPVLLTRHDARPGFGPLAERLPMTLTARDLLRHVLIDSDNSASDRLLDLGGGPRGVTQSLRTLGIGGIDVSRPEAQIFVDYNGIRKKLPEDMLLEWFLQEQAAVPLVRRQAAALAYARDPRDTATPAAMVALLRRLQEGRLLNPEHTAEVIALMQQCSRAQRRMKGKLPEGTVVAHRPGTGGEINGVNACTNDAGIVGLPGDTGHIAVAIFLQGSPRPLVEREAIVAELARSIYDSFGGATR